MTELRVFDDFTQTEKRMIQSLYLWYKKLNINHDDIISVLARTSYCSKHTIELIVPITME